MHARQRGRHARPRSRSAGPDRCPPVGFPRLRPGHHAQGPRRLPGPDAAVRAGASHGRRLAAGPRRVPSRAGPRRVRHPIRGCAFWRRRCERVQRGHGGVPRRSDRRWPVTTFTLRRALGVAVVALLALSACRGAAEGGGVASAGGEVSPGTEVSGQGSLDEEVQALAFAECMRGNGVDMPDPAPGQGGLSEAFHDAEETYDGATGRAGPPPRPQGRLWLALGGVVAAAGAGTWLWFRNASTEPAPAAAG